MPYRDRHDCSVSEKRLKTGFVVFQLTDNDYVIREGRFKAQLFRPTKVSVPPDPKQRLKLARTYIDFTIEIFEYESWQK